MTTDVTTPEGRAELRRLARAATPGPWTSEGWNPEANPLTLWVKQYGAVSDPILATTSTSGAGSLTQARDNATYIAAAHPGAVLALLDEYDKLEADFNRLLQMSERFAQRVNNIADLLTPAAGGPAAPPAGR